jgi:hypothetical protein
VDIVGVSVDIWLVIGIPVSFRSSVAGANVSQTNFSTASDSFSGHQAATDSQPLRSNHVDLRGETTDDDSALIALGKQFEEAAAEVQALFNPAEPDSRLEQIEAALARLEPLERAIMTMPARTTAGLGVKARHAAYVMSEYWNGPIDRIDWDARAVRLLIEAVCKVAHVPLPFGGAAGDVET